MTVSIRLASATLLAVGLYGQVPPQSAPPPQTASGQPARFNAADAIKRSIELMESTSTVLPGLKASSASLVADARATMEELQRIPNHAANTYHLLNDLHAFLQIADVLPRPADIPQEGQRQINELHDTYTRLETYFRQLLVTKENQLRSPDRNNTHRYAAANRDLQPPTSGRVVFFGDSITDGWRLNEYFPNKDFVNRGISGQITGEMLGRMKPDVIDLRPKAMILLAGTNDLARGTEPRIIENNIIAITELARANNIKVILCSILPVSDYHKSESPRYEMTKYRDPAKIREVNQWMQQYCKTGVCTYADYFSAMVDSAGMLQSDLADDGLHPNAKGYRIMAPIALRTIDEVVRPAAAAPVTTTAPTQDKKRGFNPFGKK